MSFYFSSLSSFPSIRTLTIEYIFRNLSVWFRVFTNQVPTCLFSLSYHVFRHFIQHPNHSLAVSRTSPLASRLYTFLQSLLPERPSFFLTSLSVQTTPVSQYLPKTLRTWAEKSIPCLHAPQSLYFSWHLPPSPTLHCSQLCAFLSSFGMQIRISILLKNAALYF